MVTFSKPTPEPFTREEHNACAAYQTRLEAFIRGGPRVMEYPPPRYEEFTRVNTDYTNYHSVTNGHGYPNSYPYANPYPMYPAFNGFQAAAQPAPNPNTISMPARSLDQIMKVIGDRRDAKPSRDVGSYRGNIRIHPRQYQYQRQERFGNQGRFRGRGRGGRPGNDRRSLCRREEFEARKQEIDKKRWAKYPGVPDTPELTETVISDAEATAEDTGTSADVDQGDRYQSESFDDLLTSLELVMINAEDSVQDSGISIEELANEFGLTTEGGDLVLV
jgi:hypothetical protein